MNPLLEQAGAHLRAGRPILLFDRDDREGETDLFFAAEHATPAAVRELRREAGGLIFMAVDPLVATKLSMPFLQDVFEAAAPKFPVLADARVNDLRYDTRSSFSLPINHRGTFTGITDDDRSLTIREFGKLAKESADLSPTEGRAAFGTRFRTPGHVHVCVGAPNLLAERQGHTELAIALAREVGIPPVLVGAEMLGEGKALKPTEARSYAAKRGTVFLEGASIIEAYGARGRKETQAQGGSAAAAARAATIP